MADPSQVLSKEAFRSFKHLLYPRRFALALFFALLLFPLIGAGLVAGTIVLVVPLFAFLIWMSGRVLYATFMGHSILVSEAQLCPHPPYWRRPEDPHRIPEKG